MRVLALACAGAIVLFCAARLVGAAPVNYQESVGGDLPDATPLTTFTLEVGANTISGTITGSAGATSDFDSFAFVVPAGLQVTAAGVALADGAGQFDSSIWELRAGSANFGQGTFVESVFAPSPGADAVDAVPLNAGVYHFAPTIIDWSEDPSTANYTFTLAVVPEPASLPPLVLVALTLVGGVSRSRRVAPARPILGRQLRCATAAVIALCGVGASGGAAQAAVSFTALGASGALGISADGATVVGAGGRWTAADGWQGLGSLPGATAIGGARAASADGSVVVGTSVNAAGVQEGFRWTAATGKVGLGTTLEFSATSAWSVSYDGSVIAGRGVVTTTTRALRWTAPTGWTLLPGFPDASQPNSASTWGVSGDGSVIVGQARSPSGPGPFAAVQWAPTGDVSYVWVAAESTAQAASADGSVIVGVISSNATSEIGGSAFRYSTAQGVTDLDGDSTIATWSRANAVSANGSVVAGRFARPSVDATWHAVIWDAGNEMQRLDEVLADGGVDLTGWTLTNAVGISADGLTIVGTGINPAGQSESWVATIPEPTAIAPLILAGALAGRRSARSVAEQTDR